MQFFDEFKELSEASAFKASKPLPDSPVLANPVCGDEVSVRVDLRGSRVERLTYWARGCWPVTGCLEYLGRRFHGRTVEECLRFGLEDFLASIDGVPASKRHAFSLTHRAVRRALVEGAARTLSLGPNALGPGGKERV